MFSFFAFSGREICVALFYATKTGRCLGNLFFSKHDVFSVYFYVFSDVKNSDFRAFRARKYSFAARFAREKSIPRAPRAENAFLFFCIYMSV